MDDSKPTLSVLTPAKQRAPLNRTLTLSLEDRERLKRNLLCGAKFSAEQSGIAHGQYNDWRTYLSPGSVDLLILDPPYNLAKTFGEFRQSKLEISAYSDWLDVVLSDLKQALTPTASIYICSDWLTSVSVYDVATRHFVVRNRITWEREKGRGALRNWKNSSEDIWYCTVSNDYVFNVDSVKLRRRVLAPYTDGNGLPKDWSRAEDGNFRNTHPSNLWTDITVPFWSMPENTDHPTQKSEKLMARLILASSLPGALVLDPFCGSGTTNVVAAKLQRRSLGIDINVDYCLFALRRLELAARDKRIQGYDDGVFWERNSAPSSPAAKRSAGDQLSMIGP